MKQFFLSLILCLVAVIASAQTTYFHDHLSEEDPWQHCSNEPPVYPYNVNTLTGVVNVDHVLYQYTINASITGPIPVSSQSLVPKGTAIVIGLEDDLGDYALVDRTPTVYEDINIYHTITLYLTDDLDDEWREDYATIVIEVTGIQAGAFQNNNKIRNVHIEEGINSIGDNAFAGSSITEVSIPQGLTNVGSKPFASCPNLHKVRLQSREPQTYFLSSVGNIYNVFVGISNDAKIEVPSGSSSEYRLLFEQHCGESQLNNDIITPAPRFSGSEFDSHVKETFMATYYLTICVCYNFSHPYVTAFMADYSRGHIEFENDEFAVEEVPGSGRYCDKVLVKAVTDDQGWWTGAWIGNGISNNKNPSQENYVVKYYYSIKNGIREYENNFVNSTNNRWNIEFLQRGIELSDEGLTISGNLLSSETHFTQDNSGEYGRLLIFNSDALDNDILNITADPGTDITVTEVQMFNEFIDPVVHYFSYPFDFSYDDLAVRITSDNIDQKYDTNKSRYNRTGNISDGGYAFYKYNEDDHSNGAIDGYAYELIDDPEHFDFKRGIGYAFVGFDLGDTVQSYRLRVIKEADNYEVIPIIGPKVEDYTITDGLSYTENSESSAYSGWNLLGNPFYASISERDYLLGDHDDWENFVGYVSRLDEKNNFERSRTYSSTSRPVASNDILFVKIPNSNPLSLTVKAPGSTTSSSKPKNLDVANITLSLSRSGDFCDKTHIAFNETANEQFVENEDLNKMVEPGAASLYSFAGTTKCEFNVYGVDEESVVVPLGLKVWQNGSFTFSLDKKSTRFDGSIVLVDNQKGTRTNLTNSKYTINLSRGDIESRFYLEIDGVIAEPQVVTGMETEESGVVAYVKEGVLTVEGIELLSMITVTDAAGHRLVKDVAAGTFTFELPARGIYFVTVNGETYKVVY